MRKKALGFKGPSLTLGSSWIWNLGVYEAIDVYDPFSRFIRLTNLQPTPGLSTMYWAMVLTD